MPCLGTCGVVSIINWFNVVMRPKREATGNNNNIIVKMYCFLLLISQLKHLGRFTYQLRYQSQSSKIDQVKTRSQSAHAFNILYKTNIFGIFFSSLFKQLRPVLLELNTIY